MDLELSAKRVIISGASRGIGLAIAGKFLSEGASVAFFARGQEGVDTALAALGTRGEVYGSAVDAADHDAVRSLGEDSRGAAGRH